VAQPCGGEVERGLTVRERAHDTRAPPDLAQDALERVVNWHDDRGVWFVWLGPVWS
jgi:hypothetical protein